MGTTYNDPVVFGEEVTFAGTVIMIGSFTPPDESVGNENIRPSANIDCDKLCHRHSKSYEQLTSIPIGTDTRFLHLCRKTGELISVKARVATAPVGGDKVFTVDVQKAVDGSNSWTSLLATPIQFEDGDADHTAKDGILAASVTLAVNDVIRIVIAQSGSTGTQGQGVIAEVVIDESGV